MFSFFPHHLEMSINSDYLLMITTKMNLHEKLSSVRYSKDNHTQNLITIQRYCLPCCITITLLIKGQNYHEFWLISQSSINHFIFNRKCDITLNSVSIPFCCPFLVQHQKCIQSLTVLRRGTHSNRVRHVRWLEVWTGEFDY